MSKHYCFEGERVYYKNFNSIGILETTHWDFTVEACKTCGQMYLRAHLETNGFSHSGLWVMCELGDGDRFDASDEQGLLRYFYDSPRLYYGGSHWNSTGGWAEKHERSPVYVNLKSHIYV